MKHIADLLQFMDSSVVNFYAVDTLRRRLEAAGFASLDMRQPWHLDRGGKYYVTQNDSALFAFIVGTDEASAGYKIISAHSDSPGFRLKPNCEMLSDGRMLRLNTEVYGGPILYTWFDRPLSLAGRVILRSAEPLRPIHRLVRFDEPLLTIPHLAIHFNRSVNEGNPLSKQRDMLPIMGRLSPDIEAKGYISRLIAERLGVAADDILDYDISLYDTTPASTVGIDGSFVTGGRLDDLSMVHAALTALLECDHDTSRTTCTRVMAIFDNEETGSGSKQGAASPILEYILRRINAALGGSDEDYMRGVASSFMISADNAHGVHPNYVDKQDPTNHPVLGDGPAIKINANCKYMTDADSAAVFRAICDKAGVPCQYFVNHSDSAGGSTLGNILTSQIAVRGVDMGAPLWAMHSARETASAADHEYTIAAFTAFYDC
ncbi:MAG: M18 family aminopeptidase [Muribaculaceae bacterium]